MLGCILLDPECIGTCLTLFKAGGQVFYDLRHRTIYELCVDRWDKQLPLDLITLQQALRDAGTLEGVGGISYLATLPDLVPSAANLEYYAEIVLQKFVLRRIITVTTEVRERAEAEPTDVGALVLSAAANVEAVTELTVPAEVTVHTPKKLVPEALAFIEHLSQNAGNVTGLASGLLDLDYMTWGFQPRELYILAARPSVGKTALALNIADHITGTLRIPVGFFSLEMDKDQLMVRMLCARSHVSSYDVRKGALTQHNTDQLVKASGQLIKAPLYIDDTSGLSILELRARARRMIKQFGLKMVMVDYLQLMTAPTRRTDNRQQEVAMISSGLKALAKEASIPVLALSQLSRKMEDRGNHSKPKLSDLRESGAIEQDADVVLLLSRKKQDDATNTTVFNATVNVAKNRNGPTGEVDLVYISQWTRFESVSKLASAEDDDAPSQQEFDT